MKGKHISTGIKGGLSSSAMDQAWSSCFDSPEANRKSDAGKGERRNDESVIVVATVGVPHRR